MADSNTGTDSKTLVLTLLVVVGAIVFSGMRLSAYSTMEKNKELARVNSARVARKRKIANAKQQIRLRKWHTGRPEIYLPSHC